MSNSSNSNSYLILYLVIILVLIYAITFMSGYTCNVLVQPDPTLKPNENFDNYNGDEDNEEYNEDDSNSEYYSNGVPAYPYEDFYSMQDHIEKFESQSSGGDFTITATGYANQLYTQTITNNGTDGWVDGSAVAVPNSQSCSEICGLPNGSFVGIGMFNDLYTRATISSPWVGVNNSSLKFLYISPSNDNMFLVTGTDYKAYKMATLQSVPVLAHNGMLGKIIQLQDGSLLCVGGGGLDTLYTMNSDWTNMKQITHDNITKITYVQQGPDGTIYGLLNGNTFAKKKLSDLTNESVPWTNTNVCCFTSFSITQTPSQRSPGTLASPALTANDFTLIGVGYANQVYIQDVIGGIWYPNSLALANSQSVTDICGTPSGGMYGIGQNNGVYFKQNLNSAWVFLSAIDGVWVTVSMMNDGHTLLLVGKDSLVYTYDTANNNGGKPAQKMGQDGGVFKIIQLQDNSYLLVGGGGSDTLYTTSNPANGWQLASKSDVGITSIAQTPNGSIIGLMGKAGGGVYTKGADWNTWTKTLACCFSAISVLPIPPQTINGYDRKGAFIDSSARTIPNSLGTTNTLSECINVAQEKGYNTAGFQYMNQCFGGNNPAYDSLGFQTNNTLNVSAYPGSFTNIVYKTSAELVTASDPVEGEVFLYETCQFGGSGSKLSVGQYPDFGEALQLRSIKLGPNTKLTFYPQANFGGGANLTLYGYSDAVNKDYNCATLGVGFTSGKVEKYPNALPSEPANLTNAQLATLWTNAGCKSESIGFSQKAITYWKQQKKISDVTTDMKNWATESDPVHKEGCYTMAPQPNVPSEGEVVLFEGCDFTGRYKKFGMGNVAFVGSDFNDITSAIKIGPFTSVTIYESMNFAGKSASWKNDSDAVSTVSCLTANSFNDMLSSLKVTSSTAQVSNTLDIRANPVTVLGPWNTPPWGVTTFADKNAQWIWWNKWNGAFPNGSAPIDAKPVRFQVLIPVSGNRDIPVVIHVIADNAPQGANFVKVNGKLVGQIIDSGWTTPNYTQIASSLAPGNNLVEFDVQNFGGGAGLLVSVINSDSFEVLADSGTGQWGWVDPSKVISAILSEEVGSEFSIHDEAAKGKVVTFKNLGEISQIMVGGTFRLSMNLTSVPPYIKGQQYKTGDTNKFYLSIEKIDPNCQVQDSGKCMNIYVDNKKCANATLSNVSRTNAYRFVLCSSAYVLDPTIPFGKNVDFTLVRVGEKVYLKNVQTGYMPKLFLNDYKQKLYGYMDTSYLSNISSLKSNQNKLCGTNAVAETPSEESSFSIGGLLGKAAGGFLGKSEQEGGKTDQKFVNCSTNADGSTYLMTTTNLVESNPVKFVINKDGTVSIRLQQYNSYGNIDKTFSLISCNFNVNTYAFIEKLTNPLGTFLINMVCFDPDDNRQLPKNTLNLSVEMSKYPDSYLKDKNIYNLNA